MKKVLSYLLVLSMMIITLVGCGQKAPLTESTQTENVESTQQQSEVSSQVEETESHEGMVRSPLSGEWVTEEVANNRPVALMVENTKVTLPQYGISKADVIYECPVEGGITRLMAIFQDYDGMDKIGNIRSCREYYVYFAREFDAVYFHAGESKYAKDLLASGFIDEIDGITGRDGKFFYRDSSRKAPHNFYTSSEGIKDAIADHKFDTTIAEDYSSHYQFADEKTPNELKDGADCAVVKLYYQNNSPYFIYNADDGLYYRYEFSDKQIDAVTNEQLTAKNIIIQYCKSSMLDSKSGTWSIDHLSGGTGKYITNGKCIDITWTRKSDKAQTKYFDADGNEIVLNPGTTWVQVCQQSKADKNKFYATIEEFKSK